MTDMTAALAEIAASEARDDAEYEPVADALREARGICHGIALSVPIWILIGLGCWAIF